MEKEEEMEKEKEKEEEEEEKEKCVWKNAPVWDSESEVTAPPPIFCVFVNNICICICICRCIATPVLKTPPV